MKAVRWQVAPSAILLFALLYFFDRTGVVSALLPAALVHELGHVAALSLCGAPIRQVQLNLSGVELAYAGMLRRDKALWCLSAGPAAGLLFSLAACRLGTPFWRLSGAVSFCLSIFNLLPVLPLDGGRILCELTGERFTAGVSQAAAAAMLLAGGALLVLRRTPFPLAMGLWLYACQLPAAPQRGI